MTTTEKTQKGKMTFSDEDGRTISLPFSIIRYKNNTRELWSVKIYERSHMIVRADTSLINLMHYLKDYYGMKAVELTLHMHYILDEDL